MKMKKVNSTTYSNKAVCPVCKSIEVVGIDSLVVDDTPLLLHKELGEVWQCQNPECLSYFLKVNEKFEPMSKMDLLRKQKEITDLLGAEREMARARLFPKVREAALKAEAGKVLSPVLYRLTAETKYYRAYSIEELLDACSKLGVNPSQVEGKDISFILGYLREHY